MILLRDMRTKANKRGKFIREVKVICVKCNQEYWVKEKELQEYLEFGECVKHGCNGSLK